MKLKIRARNLGYNLQSEVQDFEKLLKNELSKSLGKPAVMKRVKNLLYGFVLDYKLVPVFIKWLEGKGWLEQLEDGRKKS